VDSNSSHVVRLHATGSYIDLGVHINDLKKTKHHVMQLFAIDVGCHCCKHSPTSTLQMPLMKLQDNGMFQFTTSVSYCDCLRQQALIIDIGLWLPVLSAVSYNHPGENHT
jgi:hypothetical protein